jgi:hypothetical protein
MAAASLYAVQAMTHTVALFYLAVLTMGFSNAGTRVLRTTYLLFEIPNQVYGRASGIFNMLNVFMRIIFIAVFAFPFFTRSNHVIYTLIILSIFLVISSAVILWVRPHLHRMPK